MTSVTAFQCPLLIAHTVSYLCYHDLPVLRSRVPKEAIR
jgi:hypothetical protein